MGGPSMGFLADCRGIGVSAAGDIHQPLGGEGERFNLSLESSKGA